MKIKYIKHMTANQINEVYLQIRDTDREAVNQISSELESRAKNSEAHNAGYDARVSGQHFCNPYKILSDAWRDWRAGWDSAPKSAHFVM